MRVGQCVCAVSAVEVPVLVSFRSSCHRVTGVRFVSLAVKNCHAK